MRRYGFYIKYIWYPLTLNEPQGAFRKNNWFWQSIRIFFFPRVELARLDGIFRGLPLVSVSILIFFFFRRSIINSFRARRPSNTYVFSAQSKNHEWRLVIFSCISKLSYRHESSPLKIILQGVNMDIICNRIMRRMSIPKVWKLMQLKDDSRMIFVKFEPRSYI